MLAATPPDNDREVAVDRFRKGSIFVCALCVLCVAPPQTRAGTPNSPTANAPDPREEEALDLVVSAAAEDDSTRRTSLVRKLAGYRYPSVALALIQMAEEPIGEESCARELEWAIVAMGELALEPLVESLVARRIPADLATLVLKRIARQEPRMLVPYLNHAQARVARAAALAMVFSGHPEASLVLRQAEEQTRPEARAAVLTAHCRLDPENCPTLLSRGLRDRVGQVRLAAIDVIQSRQDQALRMQLVPLLHDRDPAVVRAALEAVSLLGAGGLEADLTILFKAAPDDLQEQILRLMARTGTPAAVAFLADFIRESSKRTRLGRLARTLRKESAGDLVIKGDADGAVPHRAVLRILADGRYQLSLTTEEGFRVVVRGTLFVHCKGNRRVRTNVNVDSFGPDGTLPISVTCRQGGAPEVHWRRRDGTTLRADHEQVQ